MKNCSVRRGQTVTSTQSQTRSSCWNAIAKSARNAWSKFSSPQKTSNTWQSPANVASRMISISRTNFHNIISPFLLSKIKISSTFPSLIILIFSARNTINLSKWNALRMELICAFLAWKTIKCMNWKNMRSHKYSWKLRINQKNWRNFRKRPRHLWVKSDK